MDQPDVSVIIPAAGEGVRMGGDRRKPFLTLAGEPILFRTCRALRALPAVLEIIIAVHPDDLEEVQNARWDEARRAGVELAVAGGSCRAESVWNAMQVVSARAELIAVHDAVRPFVGGDLLAALVSTARKRGAAVPVVPMLDTPKRIEGDTVVETPRRTGLMRAQTPQVFQSDLLIEAYEYRGRTGGLDDSVTDDAQLVEAMGGEVAAVYGSEINVKITTPADLRLAEAILAAGLAPTLPTP
ncbi:MAG: 2-C-methyl-D-erythritol 4-phosphate cytidylyltransferase [Planctomycetes bacterium]|nr:2-C-methyl-D-erythritol 4-phosphate cytidylyltransferase [Planctomycetota bacterium]